MRAEEFMESDQKRRSCWWPDCLRVLSICRHIDTLRVWYIQGLAFREYHIQQSFTFHLRICNTHKVLLSVSAVFKNISKIVFIKDISARKGNNPPPLHTHTHTHRTPYTIMRRHYILLIYFSWLSGHRGTLSSSRLHYKNTTTSV